jgi:hypothetical protein
VSKIVILIQVESGMMVVWGWGKVKSRIKVPRISSFRYTGWVSARDVLYNFVPVVNEPVLNTENFQMSCFVFFIPPPPKNNKNKTPIVYQIKLPLEIDPKV